MSPTHTQEHDAAELARLAQLLAECWRQQRLLGAQPAVGDAAPAAPPDWRQELQAWQQSVQELAAAVGQLGSEGSGVCDSSSAAAEQQAAACRQLAAAATSLLQQRRAAAGALPAERCALQAAEAQVADATAAAVCGSPAGLVAMHTLQQQVLGLERQRGSVTACTYLAA